MSASDDIKGKVDEAAGKVLGKKDLEAKGKLDQIKSNIEDGVEKAKDTVGDAVNDVLDKVKDKTEPKD